MKRGSSLRFMEWPMPQILLSVVGAFMFAFEAYISESVGGVFMQALLAHFLGRMLHGLDDVVVPGAAAQVSGDRLADLELARVLVPLEERAAGDHHAGRAEAALQRVLLGEAFLDRMELAALLEALDGRDLRAVGLHREHGAGLDRLAVQHDGAHAAV